MCEFFSLYRVKEGMKARRNEHSERERGKEEERKVKF